MTTTVARPAPGWSHLEPRAGARGPASGPCRRWPTWRSVAVLLARCRFSPVACLGRLVGAILTTVVAVVAGGGVATWLRAPVFLVPLIQAS